MDRVFLVASALWCVALIGAVGAAVILDAILIDALEISIAIVRSDALLGVGVIGGAVVAAGLRRK